MSLSEAVRGKHGVSHMGDRLDLRRWSAVTWRKNTVGFPSQPNPQGTWQEFGYGPLMFRRRIQHCGVSQHTIRQSPPLSGSPLVSPPSSSWPWRQYYPPSPPPMHRTMCVRFQPYSMRHRMKGPGIIFTLSSPQVPSPTIWQLSCCLSSNWRFYQMYEFLRGKAAWGVERMPSYFLGKVFRRQHRLEREREHGLETRGFIQLVICYKWPFPDDLWLRFVLKKELKTRGGPCDARHASSWGESLKTADVVTIFTAWILPSLRLKSKKKTLRTTQTKLVGMVCCIELTLRTLPFYCFHV